MNTNKTNYIPIVLAADNNYAQHLGIALISLFEKKLPSTKYKVYIIDGGIKTSNKEKLGLIESKYRFSINYLNINSKFLKDLPLIKTAIKHLNIVTYYRVFIPSLINEDRAIYLDSDIVIASDLSKLFNLNIGNYAIGAAPHIPPLEEKLKRRSPLLYKLYVNAGVLLISINKWNDLKITEKSLDFAKMHSEKMEFADQDAINYTCQDNIKLIDFNYNVQVGHIFNWRYLVKNPSIIHYTGATKPWHYLYNGPYKKLYKKYLKISPWKDYKYPDKNLKTGLKKIVDLLKLPIIYMVSENTLSKLIKIKHKIADQAKI